MVTLAEVPGQAFTYPSSIQVSRTNEESPSTTRTIGKSRNLKLNLIKQAIIVTRLTKGIVATPPRFSQPNPLMNMVSIDRHWCTLSKNTTMSTIHQGVT